MIIVDDGSDDKTGKICDFYQHKDKRVIIVHQENKGVSTARNVAIDMAIGEWIMFVDSDDEIDISM